MAKGAITVKIDGQYDNKDINRAIKDLNALKTQTGATSKSAGLLNTSFKGLAIGISAMAGIAAVTDFLKESMQAAMDDEKSMVLLAKAMQNVGVGAQNAQVEDFVKQLSLATGVVDDDLRPSLQKLITATGDVGQAEALLQTAMNASAATGKDLATVTQAITRASMGSIGALTRIGIPIDANIVKAKDFGAAIDVMNKSFGGQAAAAADTYAGKLLRVNTAVGEAQESIGYALLGAVEDLSNAFGGTGGLVGAIDAAGTSLGNFITGATSGLAPMAGALNSVSTATSGLIGPTTLLALAYAPLAPMLAPVIGAYQQLVGIGEEVAGAQARGNAVWASTTDRIKAVAASYGYYNVEAGRVANSTEMAAAAAEDLKAAIKGINDAISNSQSVDNYKEMLRGIGEALKGTVREMDGWGNGAKKNRDTLRGAFSDMTGIVQGWVDSGKISVDQFGKTFDGKAKSIVDKFVAQGFKRADIEAFLAKEGIWTSPAIARVKAMRDKIAGLAPSLLTSAGSAMAAGLAQGLANSGAIDRAVIAVTQGAINKANAILEIHSPSKVFARMGASVGDGLAEGITGSQGKVSSAIGKLTSVITEAEREAAKARGALIDAARTEVNDALAAAQDAVTSWTANARTSLAGGFDIGTAYAAAIGADGALSVQTWIDGAQAQADQVQWFSNVLEAIKANGGSQELIDYLLSKGAESGGMWGQAMLTNGLIPKFNELLAGVQTTVTTGAQSLVPAFLTAGVDSAQATVNGFNAQFGAGGPARTALGDLMTSVADSMKRDTTITVTTIRREVSEAAAGLMKRAAGGPVTGGLPYIVGERGPEMFVPSSSGVIVPNNAGTSGGSPIGGNSYNITVQAGVGDPRAIGQQVVEYIKRFEQANGKTFAAA